MSRYLDDVHVIYLEVEISIEAAKGKANGQR